MPENEQPPTDEELPAETAPEEESEGVTEASVDVPATIRRLTLNIGGEPAEKAILARIWDGIQERLGNKSELIGFKVIGDFWFSRWSNSFEDRDGEWFAEKAHDDFIDRLRMGAVPMPELWVEHIPGTRIGQAKVVSRVGHFVVAAGTFDNTTLGNKAKAYYQKHPMKGVSHGFQYDPKQYVDRVFHQYNSFEFSPLRRKTPSNPWTTFREVIAMKLTEKDLSILNEMFGEDVVKSEILEKTEQASKALEEANVRFKDFVASPEPVSPAAEVVENAERDFKQFLSDVVGDHAEVVQIAAGMAKAWDVEAEKSAAQRKATDEKVVALEAEVTALKELVKEIQDGAPRASQSDKTVVETSHLSEELQKALKEQTTEKHSFWGTEIQKA